MSCTMRERRRGHQLERLAVLLLLAVLFLQGHAGRRVHHRERRAQLVRGVGHEAALLLEGRAEAREQLVEGRGELPQLVARVGDGQLAVETPGPDAARGLGHRGHRREPAAREEPAAEARQQQRRRRRQVENLPQRLQLVFDPFERLAGEDDEGRVGRRNPDAADGEAVAVVGVRLLGDRVEVDLFVGYRGEVGEADVEVFFVGVFGEEAALRVEDHHRLLRVRQLGGRALRGALARLPLLRVVGEGRDGNLQRRAQALVHAPVERAREQDVDGGPEGDEDERERAHVPQRQARAEGVNHRRRPPAP
jgi:hypothetical protein